MMKNQEVRGDDKPINDKGGSMSGDFSKSLGEAYKSDLVDGFQKLGGIKKDTQSDKGEFV